MILCQINFGRRALSPGVRALPVDDSGGRVDPRENPGKAERNVARDLICFISGRAIVVARRRSATGLYTAGLVGPEFQYVVAVFDEAYGTISLF